MASWCHLQCGLLGASSRVPEVQRAWWAASLGGQAQPPGFPNLARLIWRLWPHSPIEQWLLRPVPWLLPSVCGESRGFLGDGVQGRHVVRGGQPCSVPSLKGHHFTEPSTRPLRRVTLSAGPGSQRRPLHILALWPQGTQAPVALGRSSQERSLSRAGLHVGESDQRGLWPIPGRRAGEVASHRASIPHSTTVSGGSVLSDSCGPVGGCRGRWGNPPRTRSQKASMGLTELKDTAVFWCELLTPVSCLAIRLALRGVH